ncbi:MAG: hypothetical protein J0M12_10825 [Deltaproteobacteria bacterium]|nr:hypothetical protein [Deltaproteobacteria bacterium]
MQAAQTNNWREALESAVQLQDAPNRELRGRTPDVAVRRIENFLRRDEVYLAARNEFAESAGESASVQREAKAEFRETTERALKIVERLATRNPDIKIPLDLEQNAKYLYRLVALHLLLERTGKLEGEIGDTSLLGVKAFTRLDVSSELQARRTQPSNTPEPEQPSLAPELTPTREEEHFYNTWPDYMSFRPVGIADQCQLFKTLVGLNEPEHLSPLPFLRSLSECRNLGSGPMFGHLQAVATLAEQCRQFGDGTRSTFSATCALYDRVLKITEHRGLEDISDPVGAMHDDGFLSKTGKEYLEQAALVRDSVPAVVMQIVEATEQKHRLSVSDVTGISETVQRLRVTEQKEDDIRSRLSAALAVGADRVPHIINCGILAVRGVRVNDLFVIGKDAASIVAAAAAGQYDRLPQNHSRYAKDVRERIDVELKILRQPDGLLKQDFEHAIEHMEIPANVRKSQIREALFCVAEKLPEANRRNQLISVGAELASIAGGGGNLESLQYIIRNPQAEVPLSSTLKFISNLAYLQKHRAQGTPQLIEHAVSLTKHRQAGDQTQDVRGIFVEAEVGVNLSRAGYTIMNMSLTKPSTNYDYDIIAISPSGELLALEVKRTFSRFVSKNVRMHDDAQREGSQLSRFMQACKKDGFVPCLAVTLTSEHRDAAEALLDQIQGAEKVRPRVLDGNNGKVIAL